MNNRGMTLIETVMGMACLTIIVGIVVGLFMGTAKSFNVTYRQTNVLTAARKAFEGDGAQHGTLWAIRNGSAFQDLSGTSLDLFSATGASVLYTQSNGTLSLTKSGGTAALTSGISAMTLTYYTMNSSGLIAVSTSAANAVFATVLIQAPTAGTTQTPFYSGARLRNHS